MKTFALLAAASAFAAFGASPALAQVPPAGSALPPPALHDPGTTAVAPAAARSTSPATALPSMRDSSVPRDARGAAPPEVSVHQRGDDTVQEYRRNGQVYMVVITPKSGIAQTYMVDPQGRLVDEHGQKPVRPVMYKVLEWGKSPPAPAASSATPADAGR